MIGRIAVSAATYAIDTLFRYRIPPSMHDRALPGVRVLAPFGRGNRPTEGFLLLTEEGEDEALKSISQILDDQPVLSEKMLRLAAFLRDRYFCTMYDAARALLPAGLWYSEKRRYCISGSYDPVANAPEPGTLDEELLQRILCAGGSMDEQLLTDHTDGSTEKAIGRLLTRGLLTVMTDTRAVPQKTQQSVSLAVSTQEALACASRKKRSASAQAAVLEFLAKTGTADIKEITYYTGANAAVVRRLRDQGWLTITTRQVLRQPDFNAKTAREPIVLNGQQQAVCSGLTAQMRSPNPGVALLYGVTGSGKTAVYLSLIRQALEDGKDALLLVPEIALTPQLTRLFASVFPGQIAVLHSGLRLAEHYDQWQQIRSGRARVVIGARSAVFAPVQNPGVIIVDEEQEHSYKSESGPRYHAREVAIYRGQKESALVVLGSATPSIESMYRARNGTYSLYTLRQRYGGAELPQVRLADTKKDLCDGSSSPIGSVLRKELEDNLRSGHQSILFINRRGNSRLLICTGCGHVPKCTRCSVSLTWHSANGRLMCHYCGHSEPAPEHCPECGGILRPVGSGTQRIEQELALLFPGTKVLRMDTDTITAANTHQVLLDRFEKERIPILVGTQMVAKGLDLQNVTLVGVLDADMSLYVDDFRAGENTFHLICQVVGRAGRGRDAGRAVIQTMTPDSRVLQLAAAQDYDSFYELEMQLRQGRSCPPFCDLITISFSALQEDQALQTAWRFRQALEQHCQNGAYTTLGPAAAPIARVNLYYRYRLTLAGTNTRPLRQLIAGLVREFSRDRQTRGVAISADVNAYD